MKLPPFLLDQWLDQKFSANTSIEYDLGSSTGPVWTFRELLALAGDGGLDRLLDTALSYTPAGGSPELRQAIAAMDNVDPDAVQGGTGAAEALVILFFLAAESGINVVLPSPGSATTMALPDGLDLGIRRCTARSSR